MKPPYTLKEAFKEALYLLLFPTLIAGLVLLLWTALLIAKDAEEPTVKVEIVETAMVEPDPLPAEPVVLKAGKPVFEEPEIDWSVQEQLAVGIYREGGGDAVCDDCRVRIGDVMLNRVADDRFPDTLEEVLTQKGQYGTMHWDGISWPARAAQPEEFHAVQRAYDTAQAILTGTHSELYGQGYIYQSEFPDLGHDAFEHCGIYFAKG